LASHTSAAAAAVFDDYPQLRYPAGLFGRAREFAQLAAAARRPHPCPAVLLHGPPGIGKSALLESLQAEVSRRGGWCAVGVFADQPLSTPYRGLALALTGLARQILVAPPPDYRRLQQRLRAALGRDGALLQALAPAFAPILGAIPGVTLGNQPHTNFDAPEQIAHLTAAMRRLFAVLGEGDRPLVLCLDDVQWADLSSLEIVRRLLLESPQPDILLVLAFRTAGEGAAGPAAQITLAEIRRQRPEVVDLAVTPLDLHAIVAILDAALANTASIDGAASAGALHAVTQGNPLLLRQVLTMPDQERHWQRSDHTQPWRWDPGSAAGLDASALLQDLLAQRLQGLDDATLTALTAAACVGPTVAPGLIAALLAADRNQIAQALQDGAAAGLLVALDADGADQSYRFVHDEVRRLLQHRLEPGRLRALHARIAGYLLETTTAGARGEAVFAIAAHMAAAYDPARDGGQASSVAAICLEAARTALALSALHTAAAYARQARVWAAAIPDGWRDAYALVHAAHELAAQTALYSGDVGEMKLAGEAVLRQAHTPVDKAGVYNTYMIAATLQGDYTGALDLLQQALAELGVDVPRRPTTAHVLAAYAQTRLALRGRSEAGLQTLPTTTDRTWHACGELVSSAYTALQWDGQRLLMAYLAMWGVRQSVQHGHTTLTAVAHALYSVMLLNKFNDPAGGARFAGLAAELCARDEYRRQRAGVLLTLNALVLHQTQPLAATIQPLRAARQSALDQGDMRRATECTLMYVIHAQMAGAPLAALAQEAANMLGELEVFGASGPLLVGHLLLQSLYNLAGEAAVPYILTGRACREEEILGRLAQTNDRFGLAIFYSFKTMLCLLFGQADLAVAAAGEAQAHADIVAVGLFGEAVRRQVNALAALAACVRAPGSVRRQLLRAAADDVKELARWAARAPVNHAHRVHQVKAELARVQGRHAEAEQHYLDAWRLAAAHGFVHDEAGVAELAARHYLHCEEFAAAAEWRRRACDAYARWGSQAKLRYLDQTLPALAADAGAGVARADGMELAPPLMASPPVAQESAGLATLTGDLRALSRYTDPQQTVSHLLSGLLTSLKLSRACFLLQQGAQTLLYAELGAGGSAPSFPALVLDEETAASTMPLALVRLALHEQAAVRGSLAETGVPTIHDPYLQAQPPLEIVCIPLNAYGHTVALLSLERRKLPGGPAGAGFSQAEELHAELMGTRAALLVENSILRQRLTVASPAAATDVAGAELTACLLGSMRVVHRSRDITGSLQGRLRDLLALLLLLPEGKAITRGELAAALWPDTVESQALTNVRNLLHKLRAAWPESGELLEISRHQIRWQAGAVVWVDVRAFERGLAEAANLRGAAAVHLLRAGVALYGGDLLPTTTAEWVLPVQERLRERYLAALGRLGDLLVEQHELTTALETARTLVAVAPLREESYRHLIRAHALAGDSNAARQAYVECAGMLAREFALEPGPATAAAYRQYIGSD
jgi:predicted ATPase/DNA-binding SARP family transcriptional activator